MHEKPSTHHALVIQSGYLLPVFGYVFSNKNDDKIIGKARKLIWVAHNAASGKSTKVLLADFDSAYQAIKTAENELYNMADRHLATKDVQEKEEVLQQAINAFQDKMPKVFDPFAGGG